MRDSSRRRRSSSTALATASSPFGQLPDLRVDGFLEFAAVDGEALQVGAQHVGHAARRSSASWRACRSMTSSRPLRWSASLPRSASNAFVAVWRASSSLPVKSAARALQHGRGRGDHVGHLGIELQLAVVEEGRELVAAAGEGRGDLAGAFDEVVVDLAGARSSAAFSFFGAGIERLGTCLELADQALAALRPACARWPSDWCRTPR